MKPGKVLITTLLLSLLSLLWGCSSAPSRSPAGDRSITPKEVAADAATFAATMVEWGGVIVESQNLQQQTELKILAYPLDSNGRPDLDASPSGRFIAVSSGYLETIDYAKGRQVTLSGKVSGVRDDKVGDADYRFPVVHSTDIQLRSKSASDRRFWPSLHIGVGGGSGGIRTGVGVGIGF